LWLRRSRSHLIVGGDRNFDRNRRRRIAVTDRLHRKGHLPNPDVWESLADWETFRDGRLA
jgi:hypothetical protein